MGRLKNEKSQKSKCTDNSTPNSTTLSQESRKLSIDGEILNTSDNSTVSIAGKSSINSAENSVYLCGSCNLAVTDELCASCEICHGWFHYACVNIPTNQAEFVNSPQIHWFCIQCNTSAQELIENLRDLTSKQEKLNNDLAKLVDTVKTEAKQQAQTVVSTLEVKIQNLTQKQEELEKNLSAAAKDEAKTYVDSRLNEEQLETKIYDRVIAKTDVLPNNDRSYAAAAAPTTEQLDMIKAELKTEFQAFTQQFPTSNEDHKRLISAVVREDHDERERIKQRAPNLIIHNLPESNSVNEDVQQVNTIIKDVLRYANFEIVKATRLGFPQDDRNRLFKITLSDIPTKKKILARATELRNLPQEDPYAKVYIRPDLTPKQVEVSKNLQKQLHDMREANQGRKFKIVKGQIKDVTEEQQNYQTPPSSPGRTPNTPQ